MVHKVYSMLDEKMEAYGPLNLSPNDGAVLRAMEESVVQSGMLNKHPEDFSLYCVGLFDDVTGELARESAQPRLVARVSEMIARAAK